MKYKIHRAVVIGAGTMGAAIAAHLANTGVSVTLLDIVPDQLTPEEAMQGLALEDPQVRNRIVQTGLDRAIKSRPVSFFSTELVRLVSIGNLEDDFQVIGEADWVIEVIVENLMVKRKLMERIDEARGETTIISTNTSGIPVASIAEGRSDGFRKYFLGTHFFNPPRYLKLVEVIPTQDTLLEVVGVISQFCEIRLGKGVVLAKDTPNFIANRLASVDGAFSMAYVLDKGYSVEEVDAITGPAIGRPKTATFRLIDLVGIDVWEHVSMNLAEAIPHDPRALRYLQAEPGNRFIRQMIQSGRLGNKTRQGFYKEVLQDGKKEFWALNLRTMTYEPAAKPRFPSLGNAKDLESLKDRLKVLLEADDRAGEFVRAVTYHDLAYASACIPEIADNPLAIDNAIRWGFGHEAGPFEVWDMLGVSATQAAIKAVGFEPAAWVDEMLARGYATFYQYEIDRKIAIYNPATCRYEALARPAALVALKEAKADGKRIARNASASLIDLGDGVACVEFHAKMNALDDDMFEMIAQGLRRTETEFEGLVISTEAENFSAGANLFMVVMAAQSGMWEQLDAAVQRMQSLNMHMRYFPRPVVVAPAGLALGGGAEICMHAGRVVASAELYAGLVEMGAGVIPAGGGAKEMLRRLLNPSMRTHNADALPFLQRIFEQIGLAKVSISADEARQMGILTSGDRIVMNRDFLLAEARKEVIHLATSGYHPPAPEMIYAAGRDALAALQVGIYMMREGGYITEHEMVVANKLATVMTGGEISQPAWVDEQYLLDLEREAFLSLCGQEKTQQRMWSLLQTGKVLRN